MSFSQTCAKAQQHDGVLRAVKENDTEALYRYANIMKKNGEDEQAEKLNRLAHKADRNDWDYDNSIGN